MTMRAAVLHRHGEPPEPGLRASPRRQPGEALIRVTAAPINPLDLLCASGISYFGAPSLPYVPGTQGVGVIAESDRLGAGQRVWFSTSAGMRPGDGSMAELCSVPEPAVQPVPEGVSDDLAAALGLSAIAAWMALAWRGRLRPGEHVLVLGASGNVGQIGVQAARLLGAGRVVAACRDSHGRDRAAELGADAVADLTGDDVEVIAARLAQAAGDRVDVVLDPVWGLPAQAALRVMSPRGRLVNLGSSACASASFGSATLRSGVLSILGYTNNQLTDEQKAAALAEIFTHARAGRLTADRETIPLDRAADGWSRCGQAPHHRAVLIP
ncbi:MAG TPA: zinc-binding alcohol dehydrogenase family protein [Streptosporangiaceae bacterium]|nr:zinc-binding alcohol dehydrogenase family protein [Streptosporangiaceae bacterium]